VDCSTRITAALHIRGDLDPHLDHGWACDCSHSNGHLSDYRHSRGEHHLEIITASRDLDIVEAAGSGRALVKTYRGLRPNAQGKLVVAFVPDVNYASVDAVEVEEQTPWANAR